MSVLLTALCILEACAITVPEESFVIAELLVIVELFVFMELFEACAITVLEESFVTAELLVLIKLFSALIETNINTRIKAEHTLFTIL